MKTKLIAVTAALLAVTAARAADLTLKETGSTLILPVFRTWAQDYPKDHPGITITTEGSGSEHGIQAAIDGSAQIGTSDAFMSGTQLDAHPHMLNIAMAIAAQTVNYNIPGLDGILRLDGPTLAQIYTGAITGWDDPAIARLNPGLRLPHHTIVPVHRADGSGDTFVFTQYLAFTAEDAASDALAAPSRGWDTSPGFGTSITWPDVAGAQSATGNAGIVELLAKTRYSLGYVGVSFAAQVEASGLGTAKLRSHSGQYLLPTPDTIAAAATALTPRTPDDERLSLINAPGDNCYPLINYEYAIVAADQHDAATAASVRRFLLWATAPDEANDRVLAAAHFIPLPAHVWATTHDQIEQIH